MTTDTRTLTTFLNRNGHRMAVVSSADAVRISTARGEFDVEPSAYWTVKDRTDESHGIKFRSFDDALADAYCAADWGADAEIRDEHGFTVYHVLANGYEGQTLPGEVIQ